VHIGILLVANMVNPRQLGAEELLVAPPGAAIQKDSQGPVERLDGSGTLRRGISCQQ